MLEEVKLGLTDLTVSRLCFGTGTNGWQHRSNQGDLGIDRLANLLRFAYDQGINFWDTADQYGTHPHVAKAHRELGRDKVTITTKTVSRDAVGVREDIERFRRELETDYLDIVLLHCLTDRHWPEQMQGPMDVLSEFKEQGIIRALGVSCHDFGALETTADTDWVDVALVRFNYAGHAMDAGPEQVFPVVQAMHERGKGIYGMKVVGGGSDLTQDPAKAVRFVLEHECIHAMVMGMMNEEEIMENTGLVAQAVLS